MKFKIIPIFWLKTIADGLADKIFHTEGIVDAEKSLIILNKYKHLIDPTLVKMELELIKNSEYLGDYKRNNIYPKEIDLNFNEENSQKLLEILKKGGFYNKNIIIVNLENINNKSFFQIASLTYKKQFDIFLDIYSINLEILANFFDSNSFHFMNEEKQNILISLVKGDSLKTKVIVPLLNTLYIKHLSEPSKRIRNAFNFFQHTDLIIHLKKGNKFLELNPYLRKIIISNEIYDLKFLSYIETLNRCKDYLPDFTIRNKTFLISPEEPLYETLLTFKTFLEELLVNEQNIKKYLLTFGFGWFQKLPQELENKYLPIKIVLVIGFLYCLLNLFRKGGNEKYGSIF